MQSNLSTLNNFLSQLLHRSNEHCKNGTGKFTGKKQEILPAGGIILAHMRFGLSAVAVPQACLGAILHVERTKVNM